MTESKTCQCGCRQEWERPAGMRRARFATRKFMSAAHYHRWLTAGGTPGAARAGKRTEPIILGARRPRHGPIT